MTQGILFLILAFSSSALGDDCLEWFLGSGLAGKTDNCELKCAVTPVDMGTFTCSNKCPSLCEKSTADQILKYVPRLTEGDKIVVVKMPYEALKVFMAKEKVDKVTSKIFKNPGRKDESDAFRHFMWSALLAKEIGPEKAKIFLSAHEQDSTQTSNEKDMDEYNNKLGLQYHREMSKKGKSIEVDIIEGEALKRLREKKLKVLKPRLKKIPGGYYSK